MEGLWGGVSPNPHRKYATFHAYGPGGRGVSAAARVGASGFLTGYYASVHQGRDSLGRFTSDFGDMQHLNQRAARYIADQAAEHIEAELLRPNVSTGRLVKATRHEDNWYATGDSFFVGNPGHLERSGAKYWRTIEEGSKDVWKHTFIGTRLTGWFGSARGGYYGAGGQITPVGGAYDSPGKFIPAVKSMKAIAAGQKWPPAGRGVVRREIEGKRAYPEAWRQFRSWGGLDDLGRAVIRKAAFGDPDA